MSSMKTLQYLSTSLTLLAVACTSDVEQAIPPQRQSTAPEVQERAIVEALGPEDLLRNGHMPFEGDALLVGGQPTPAQFEQAHELGYKTVINLRRPEEEGNTDPEQIRGLGMAYLEIPIAGSADMTEDKARALAAALESADSPVIVHCASGNRVGGLFAMKAFHIDAMSPEEALAVGKAAGMTRLEPTVREKLGLPAG